MNNCTIFVSSSDAYADIWKLFFDLFKMYWPEYNGKIVLNTQALDYSCDGLDIECTKVGYHSGFGRTFRAGLDCVKTDNVLLMMIDYIFMGNVNHQKMEEYYDAFSAFGLDSLCLEYQNYQNVSRTVHPELLYVSPPAPHVMFSYQIAFWKKQILNEMALPHESPWMSEWFGSLRAEKMKIKLACLSKGTLWPIPYDLRGCLHQGKWLKESVIFLKSINYHIDYNKRGYYGGEYNSWKYRIMAKKMIWETGLRGSYWDLLFR